MLVIAAVSAQLAGTLEFFPEEGKYHADGHRVCGVNWEPQRTREAGGRCPECGTEPIATEPKGATA